jgi:hypothetical protein
VGLGSFAGLAGWADALVALQEQLGGGGCPIANLVAQLGERDDDTRSVLATGFDLDGVLALIGSYRPPG